MPMTKSYPKNLPRGRSLGGSPYLSYANSTYERPIPWNTRMSGSKCKCAMKVATHAPILGTRLLGNGYGLFLDYLVLASQSHPTSVQLTLSESSCIHVLLPILKT